ncbi:MAG: sigma-70 family RNA polymerase sigma factor [Alphaproteobacteria bacterium]
MPRTVSRPAQSESAQFADQMEAVADSGDREAYAAIFRTFSPRIRAYLMRLGAEPAHADELTQETMVTVWRRAQTFDRRQAAVATWLFTIARNKRIDALRRERRPEFDPNDPALIPAPETPPDEHVDQAQRQVRVQAAIRTLPAQQADLLRAAFIDGQSHREIAERTGIPLGTVKSRLRLAMGHMKKHLHDLGEE